MLANVLLKQVLAKTKLIHLDVKNIKRLEMLQTLGTTEATT